MSSRSYTCASFRRLVAPGLVGFIVVPTLLSGCGGAGGNTGDGHSPSPGTVPITTTEQVTTTTMSTPYPLFHCQSDIHITNMTNMENKGIALDDDTFKGCSDKMTGLWPHTQKQVKSMRLFASWKSKWGGDTKRENSWDDLMKFVEKNDMRILMGNEITCDPGEDEQQWKWNMQLMKRLGKDRIMGVTIGNEIDNGFVDCRHNLWKGELLEIFDRRVKDLDDMGFTDTKVGVVWRIGALAGGYAPNKPAPNPPFMWKVMSFAPQVSKKYGKRLAWAFNPYAAWDASQQPRHNNCDAMTELAGKPGFNKATMTAARKGVTAITGNTDDTLWVGETGWSSKPMSWIANAGWVKACPKFFSEETLMNFYKMSLSWDLSLDEGLKGVDHMFYFTMRNSQNNGIEEGFGLIAKCSDTKCKGGGGVMSAHHSNMTESAILV